MPHIDTEHRPVTTTREENKRQREEMNRRVYERDTEEREKRGKSSKN